MLVLETRRALGEVRGHLRLHALHVVRVDPAHPLYGRAPDLVLLVAEHLLPAGREVHLVGLEVPVPEPVVGTPHSQSVALLALTEGLFGALAVGDVLAEGHHPHGVPAPVRHRIGQELHSE